jgi:hypothetical protein
LSFGGKEGGVLVDEDDGMMLWNGVE